MENSNVSEEEVIEVLEGAIDYLDKVLLLKDGIPNYIMKEDYEQAFDEFDALINGINRLNDLLTNISNLLAIDYRELSYKGQVLDNYINEFNQFLNKIIKALEAEDYLQFSDLIEFEFDMYIKQYQKVFERLLEYVKEVKLS